MVELLNEQGVAISWERVREIAQGSVGRPHIAQALMEAGYVQSIGEAFDKYIGKGCSAYVPRYKLTPVDAVRFIASANGLPVIAHPLELPGLEELRNWLPGLCEAGMLGLETYYGSYTDEEVQTLRALADEYHLIPTGGSDSLFHSLPLPGACATFQPRYVHWPITRQQALLPGRRQGPSRFPLQGRYPGQPQRLPHHRECPIPQPQSLSISRR